MKVAENLEALSVVIPAYNEAGRIGNTLKILIQYLSNNACQSEIIIVDDGSLDDTRPLVESFARSADTVQIKILSNGRNRGKGFSVRRGLLSAQKAIGLFTDADLSTPISEAPKLVRPIQEDVLDFAIGSRALDRDLIGVRQSWRREQGGKIFNVAVRAATGLPIWDTQCGFKAFRMKVFHPILQAAVIDGFAFDVELLTIAHLAKLRIGEIPVRWNHNEGSTVSMSRDSLRMLNQVRRIRREVVRGTYSEAVASVGHVTSVQGRRPTGGTI